MTDEELTADRPTDAGGVYKKPDFLLRFLEKQPVDYVEKAGRWIKIHYTHTDALLAKIRKIYRDKKSKIS